MSVDILFTALETNIRANSAFTGFKFFRFESMANSNQQSLGSVPFVKVAWKQNHSYVAESLHKIITECRFQAEIRWILSEPDINDEKRIDEYSLYDRAFKECLLSHDENFLGLSEVLSVQADSMPGVVTGPSFLKHGLIVCNCEIKYVEQY